MTAPLVVASYVTTYNSRAPYITADEYQRAPTAVDSSNLVQGGSPAQNTVELGNIIARASSIADQIVFGDQGCLAATRDMDGPRRLRVDRWGRIRFPTRYHPILQIDAIEVGFTPSTMLAFTAAQAVDVEIDPAGVITIPVWGVQNPAPSVGGFSVGSSVLTQVTYVNGYPHTTLADSADAGDTTIVVASPLGLYPGSPLTVYDFTSSEHIVVGPAYTVGSATVPLVAALAGPHTAGVSVSAVPPVVKQAVIAITSALIKTRGTLSIVMGKLQSSPTKVEQQDSGARNDFDYATGLLRPFARVA